MAAERTLYEPQSQQNQQMSMQSARAQPQVAPVPAPMRGAGRMNSGWPGSVPHTAVANASPLPQPIAMSPQQLLQVAQTRLGRQLTREESRMVLIEGLGAVKLPPAPPAAGGSHVESPHVSAAGDLAPPPPIAADARPSPFRRQAGAGGGTLPRRPPAAAVPVVTPAPVPNGNALPPPIAARATPARPEPAAPVDDVMRERGRTLSPGPRRPMATPVAAGADGGGDDAVMRDRGRTLSPGPRRPAADAGGVVDAGDAARDRARTLSPGRPMPATPASAAPPPLAPMTASAAAPKLAPPLTPARRMPAPQRIVANDDMATPSRSTPLSPRAPRARGQTDAPPPRMLPNPTPPAAAAPLAAPVPVLSLSPRALAPVAAQAAAPLPVSPLSPRAAARRQPDAPMPRGLPVEPVAVEPAVPPPASGALLSPRLPPRRAPETPPVEAEISPRAPSRRPVPEASAMRRPVPDSPAPDAAPTPLSPRTLPRRPPPTIESGPTPVMRMPARVGAGVRAPPPPIETPAAPPVAATPLSPRVPMRTPARMTNGPARPPMRVGGGAAAPPVPADLAQPPRVGSMKAPPIPASDPTPPPVPHSDGSLRRGAVQAGGQYGLTSMAKPLQSHSSEYTVVAPLLVDDRPLPIVQQESSYGQVPPQPQSNYGLTPKKASAPAGVGTSSGFTPVLSAVPLPRQVAGAALARGSGASGTPPPGEYMLQPIAARSESEYSFGDSDGVTPPVTPPPPQNEYVQVDPLVAPRESHRNEYAKVEPLGPPSEYVKVDFSDKNSASSSQDVAQPPAQPESPAAPPIPTLASSMTPPVGSSLGTPTGSVSSSSSAPMLAKGAFYGTVGISSVSHASLISNTGLMKDARVPMTLTARQSRYAPFLQILSGSSLLMINALCVAAGGADEEPLLTAICCGLDAHAMLRDAVTSGIAAEVASCADATTLFRANNGTTKLVGAFTKLVGQQYLSSLIKPYIAELSTSKDTCEVDITKLNKEDYEADFVEADVVVDNIEQLKHWTTRLLQKLTASLAECPPALKWLSAALRVGVTHRFPSSGTVSVAGFYFLRYICPALVAPVARGVTDKKPLPRVVNALKYISKMIQAMANGVVFKKEASMLPLNEYVREHSAQVNDLCTALAADTSPVMPPLASVGDAESIHLRYVYLFMVQNRDKVEKSLASYKQDEVIAMIPDVIDAIGMSQNAQLTPLKEKLQVEEVLSRKEDGAAAAADGAGAAGGGASKARGRKLERRTGRGALAMMSGAVKCEVCGERPFESRVTRADGKAVLACNACEASGAAMAAN